ncbi:MAG: hypothetical protein ACK2U9_16275, partial [Anaerolineae bacterium]
MKASLLTGSGLAGFLAILAVGLVFVYGRFYRLEAGQAARGLSPRRRGLLWGLRAAVAVLVLLALARPAVTRVKTYERLPV